MNKIDEIEPEPEVEKSSPKIPFRNRTITNGAQIMTNPTILDTNVEEF